MIRTAGSFVRSLLAKAPHASVPAGTRVYAIGDVHGCLVQLNQLLERIAADLAGWEGTSHVVFLGDLVDRGPKSAGVLDRLLDGSVPGDTVTFLMGNHEEAMLDCYDGKAELYGSWLQNGGIPTLESYGVDRQAIFSPSLDLADLMRRHVPGRHIDFLKSFEDQARIGDYVFVHAGIRPGVPLAEQNPRDLRWIRDGFLNDDTDHGFTVVHGHTIVRSVKRLSNRIAVDTGCYRTGRLSALVIEEDRSSVLSTR